VHRLAWIEVLPVLLSSKFAKDQHTDSPRLLEVSLEQFVRRKRSPPHTLKLQLEDEDVVPGLYGHAQVFDKIIPNIKILIVMIMI
jgi:hypothetical protein